MNKITATSSFTDHFLVATPDLNDGIFANSVTYICEHSDQGAMGIVINHPLDLQLEEIFQHLNISDIRNPQQKHILAGGPVSMDRGFVLHRHTDSSWDSTLQISKHIALTTSKDILTAIAHQEGPDDSLIALGYAGWNAGQLETELTLNSWLIIPANTDIIFNTPIEDRAKAAAATLGIDLSLIAPQGHA